MHWIYFTQTQKLSWKDAIVTKFLASKGVDIEIREIPMDLSSEMNIVLTSGNSPDRVVMSNFKSDSMFTTSHYLEFYVPMYLSQLCEDSHVHFSYLTQDYTSPMNVAPLIRKLFQKKKNVLYVNMSMFMDEDTDKVENSLIDMIQHNCAYEKDTAYYVSVTKDTFPILYDVILCGKTGIFELTNPTPILHSTVTSMYREYMNIKGEEEDPSQSNEHVEKSLASVHIDTWRVEEEYFILPSYQAIQRLIKRIRKSCTFQRDVNLTVRTNIMVTGGYGFIGSNLIHYLYHTFPKCLIVNIDRLDYCSRRENLEGLLDSERVKSHEIDLCCTEKVEKILRDHEIDYIFHLAAQSHVDNSFNNSLQFSRDNMYGTHSLLEAAKNYGKIIRFLHVSTDEIYGETLQKQSFAEDVLPNPTNPYAATKVGAEYIVKSYFHCFELPIIIVRGNNVYGPRQYPEKMIPKFITSILQKSPCTVAGNGLMQRNFIFVEDVCSGLVKVMQNGGIDEIYNIGSDDEKSVMGTAQTLLRIMTGMDSGYDECIVHVKDRYYNDFRYSINSEKIRGLGWAPKVSFEEGLKKTIQFYTENISLYNKLDNEQQ